MRYDRGEQTLYVQMRSGVTFAYVGVPVEIYERLYHTKRKAQFIKSYIRPGAEVKRMG